MIVRKITEDEVKRTNELFGVAFEFPVDNEKSNEQVVKEMKENPKTRGDKYYLEKWAGFDDDNEMMGWIGTLPLDVQFDGNIVKMTGIGGVSTLPQHRRNGVIRECFNASLIDMYENDYTLSYLYPFSTAYYNKFGYELCSETIHYHINLKSIKRFPEADGKVYLVENGSHYEDVKKVYNDYSKGYNLMCVHEDFDYNEVITANPAKDGNYIYVYKDKNGVAKGVMSFQKVKTHGEFNMQTKMFYFSDMEGFKGLMNHCLAFIAYYEHVVFRLPLDINITSYIPEWALYSYKRVSYFNGMVRVINVQKALQLAKYQGAGSLIIKIFDNQIDQNNNTFEVKFDNDKATSVEISTKSPDIELTIGDFSRLLMGTHNPSELKYIEKIKINTELGKIEKVFYKKLNFITDSF